MKSVKLELPSMHLKQAMMIAQAKRFNVGCCGRRFGKTVMGILLLTMPGGALHGKPCAWFAPKSKYMAKVWREVVEMLGPVIVRKNATERVIELIGGGEIEFWTMEDIDAGKSRKYARVIIDEAELAKDLKYTWEQAIRPTLTDMRGEAWFFSTPKGFNYFKELFDRGQSDDPFYKNWMSWKIPTLSNPTIPDLEEEVAEAERELPPLVFQQEYLAEFVDFGGTLIQREWLRYGVPDRDKICSTSIGVDLAISIKEDACFTAFVVMQNDFEGNNYVRHCTKSRMPFHKIIRELTKLAIRWDADIVNIEEVAFQSAVVQEMLRTTKLNIKGSMPEKNKDKLVRFLPLQPRYRNGLILHDPALDPVFERDILGFPSAADKDVPDAMVYAWDGLRSPHDGDVHSAGKRDSEELTNSRLVVTEDQDTWGTISGN